MHIRGWALINFFAFRMGAYSRLGAYLNKYGIHALAVVILLTVMK